MQATNFEHAGGAAEVKSYEVAALEGSLGLRDWGIPISTRAPGAMRR